VPRKIRPKPCACGCGSTTKGGNFLPGHDAKLLSAIVDKVGGVQHLKEVVEKELGCRIDVGR